VNGPAQGSTRRLGAESREESGPAGPSRQVGSMAVERAEEKGNTRGRSGWDMARDADGGRPSVYAVDK